MPKSDRDILAKYLPNHSVDSVLKLIQENKINLNIKKARATKFGDFRAPINGRPSRLSINSNLNSYAFLITLIHEIAHWMVWESYKNNRQLQPHGIEWKRTFQGLMDPYLNVDIFPESLLQVLQKHMLNPKASSSSDIYLMRALKEFDEGDKPLILGDLDIGASFQLKGRQFRIIKKNRSRFLCVDTVIGRKYMVHSMAEITPVD